MPNENAWPLFFTKQPVAGRRVNLKVGDIFPWQDKGTIRGLCINFGMSEAEASQVPFGELPWVQVLDVRTAELANQILARGMSFAAASKFVDGTRGE